MPAYRFSCLIRKAAGLARDLLFPPRCVGCDDLLPPFRGDGQIFCPLCRAAWETAIGEASRQASDDAARGLVYLTFYHSGCEDDVPQRLIYHIKHQGDPRVFRYVAERLAPRILQAADDLPTGAGGSFVDGEETILFSYPPRRASAIRRDGFDQAARLAKALAQASGGDFAELICRNRRSRREQKGLDAENRSINAHSAYALSENAPQAVRGRVVAVCDDVCTTGATLQRCAELLVEAGAVLVLLVAVEKTKNDVPRPTEDAAPR